MCWWTCFGLKTLRSDIPVRVELSAIRITEISLTCFMPAIEPPVFLGDQVKRAVHSP